MEKKARALSGRLQARWIKAQDHHSWSWCPPCPSRCPRVQHATPLPVPLRQASRASPPSLWGTGQASHPLFPASLFLTGTNTFMTEVRGTAGRQQGGTCCRDRCQLRHKCYCHSHHTSGPGRKEIQSYQGNR